MHRIVFGAYRDWALSVLPHVLKHPRVSRVTLVSDNSQLSSLITDHRDSYDFVLLCGWSWQPSKSVIGAIPVFSEHPVTDDPSMTDAYSLGTPLQNQILDGVKSVKHRLVRVVFPELALREYTHEVDMSLAGGMDDILDQMRATSTSLFSVFLDDYPRLVPKRWPAVPTSELRRPRTPSDSKLTKKQVALMTTRELYDFCRMLEGPYPRACIEDEHGTLTIEKVSFKSKA